MTSNELYDKFVQSSDKEIRDMFDEYQEYISTSELPNGKVKALIAELVKTERSIDWFGVVTHRLLYEMAMRFFALG